jgi:hypothetical protein
MACGEAVLKAISLFLGNVIGGLEENEKILHVEM